MSNRIAASVTRLAFVVRCRRASSSPASGGSVAGATHRLLSSSPAAAASSPTATGRRRPLSNYRPSYHSNHSSPCTSSGSGSRSLCRWCAPLATPHPFIVRAVSSTPRPLEDGSAAPEPSEAQGGGDDEEGEECPPWQNPLHHNNPDYTGKVLAEDFAPGEEMPVVPLPPFETEVTAGKVLAPPHIHALADEIVRLNMLEVKELVDRVGDHFGFDDGDAFAEDGGDGGGGDAGAEEAANVEEKTAFDLKLAGFDAKGKIKVIKEVRGMAGLGLKEAKELVEGAPTVVKKDLKKEEAEEMKAKLEAVGATVEIV